MIAPRHVEDAVGLSVGQLQSLLPPATGEGPLEMDIKVEVDGTAIQQRLELSTTRQRLGGRWWWTCPTCKRRCAHLYVLQGGLTCRLCARLRYRCQKAAGR